MVALQLLRIPVIAQSGENFRNIFYFLAPGAQSNKDSKALQVHTMTGNYQSSTIQSIIKFENYLPSGSYSKTIDFFHFILATVDQ